MTLLDWARETVKEFGNQKDAAIKIGIPYATLQRVLAGNSPLNIERLSKIAAAASPSAKEKLAALLPLEGVFAGVANPGALAFGPGVIDTVARSKFSEHASRYSAEPSTEPSSIAIPALAVKASAGDGSLLWGRELGDAPFRFAEDWLRQKFGSIASLRLIQIQGDSQLPDLSDGDWAVIDTAKSKLENGLAVIRLDECLMIKRLQREGYFLQLISRNPMYAPTAIDLSKEEERIRCIGKVVYIFKSV